METKTVNFLGKEQPEFIAELRNEVSNYFKTSGIEKQGNFSLWIKTTVMFLLYISPYVLMITGIINSFYLVWACWVIIGIGKAGVGLPIASSNSYDDLHRA